MIGGKTSLVLSVGDFQNDTLVLYRIANGLTYKKNLGFLIKYEFC